MSASVRDVSVQYGDITALQDLTINVGPGERVALVGSSGAGKSTLLDVLAGLVQPTAGSVEVLGTDLAGLQGRRARAHRSKVGVVRQSLDIPLGLQVVHNVNAAMLGQWSTPAALWSLVRPAGLAQAEAALDQVGLGGRVRARTEDLSGGERQRVAVARVLRQQPQVVLADEPTSSVDPHLADDVFGLLCSPAAPWTAIVSAHDPDLARRHATRIIGLRNGCVAFDASPSDLTSSQLDDLYSKT